MPVTITDDQLDKLPSSAVSKTSTIVHEHVADNAGANIAVAVKEDALGNLQYAKSEREQDIRNHEGLGVTIDAKRLEGHDRRIARAKDTHDKAQSDVVGASAKGALSRKLLEGIAGLVDEAPGPLKDAGTTVSLKSGHSRTEAVARERQRQGTLKKERADTEKSRLGQAAELHAFEEKLRRDYLSDGPGYSIRQTSTGPELTFPLVAVGAESGGYNHGEVASAPDLRADFVTRHWDEIVRKAREVIDGFYATEEVLVLSPEEKRQRLREIDDAILASERVECGHIWAARDAGEVIAFRPDTDPRALLDVIAPPLKSNRMRRGFSRG